MSISAGIESKTWPVVLAAITNICSLYPDNPQKEKFSSVIKRIEEANIPSDVPMRNYTQELMEGTKAYSLGDYTHALQHFLAMQEYITSPNMQSNRYRCIAWSAAADAYAGLGEYNQAIALTNKILDLAKSEHYDDAFQSPRPCLSSSREKSPFPNHPSSRRKSSAPTSRAPSKSPTRRSSSKSQ